MEKVLVTGADGFIGSHLVERLVKEGRSVKALCMYNSSGSYGWLDTIEKNIMGDVEIILGDVRDSDLVLTAMQKCNSVFHLAALIAIPYSYIAPKSYIETNIVGSLNIVQAARTLGVRRVIHTSTSETYGTAQFVPITEEHPQIGQSPYAASKIGADQIALSYWRSFGTPVSILRPFNTYGPRQSTRAVIPTIITQIAAGKKEIRLGATSPTRDFNYVKDTVGAFIAIEKTDKTIGMTINSASNFEVSIGDTAKLISKIMGTDVKIEEEAKRMRPRNSEVNRLYGDNTKLLEMTDWAPSYGGLNGFEKGLIETIDWFTQPRNLQLYRAGEYMV